MMPMGMPPPPMDPMMGMAPPPMDPMMGMMLPPEPPQAELDLELISSLLEDIEPPFKPRYPSWFKKPGKPPVAQGIWRSCTHHESLQMPAVEQMMDTIRRLHLYSQGVFESDKAARKSGKQDPMVLTALVNDWKRLVAYLTSIDLGFVKDVTNRDHNAGAQAMEDFAAWIRDMHIRRWNDRQDMILPQVEAKMLTAYGRIISRRLPNMDDERFPFRQTMCDPATTFPVFDGDALLKVFRKYKTTYEAAATDWGEVGKGDRKRFEDQYGKGEDCAKSVVTVIEYSDRWYRSVCIEGSGDQAIDLMPASAHELGVVPYVVQYGPEGDPFVTDTGLAHVSDPQMGREARWRSGPSDDVGVAHKATSSIHMQRATHDQMEAIAARFVSAMKKAQNPPLMVFRDTMGASIDLPDIKTDAGDVNDLAIGDNVVPIPTGAPASEMQAILQFLMRDANASAAPGQAIDRSNVSGVAASAANELGMENAGPWAYSLASYHTRCAVMDIMIWRNKGHLTRFKKDKKTEFFVPSRGRHAAKEMAHLITPELIDEIGEEVEVKMTKLPLSQMVPVLNAIQMMRQPNMMLISRRDAAEMIGRHDPDRTFLEIESEDARAAIYMMPEFQKAVTAPMELKKTLDDARANGSDEDVAFAEELLNYWMELIANPQIQQLQPQPAPMGGGAPGMGMPPGAGPQGPALDGAQSGVSFAQLGMGPGSQGGGPMGPQQSLGPRPGEAPFGP